MTKITALPPGMAVGFRFHPTDEELITNYLIPKILGTDSDVENVIAEVDFYKFEPWDLPSQSKIESKDQMWLFFCKPEYKRPISKQSKRTTNEGSWTITGKERLIKSQETKKCIGKKRTLVFFRGKGSKRGERTNWVFHEYFIDDNRFPNQNSYVLCRLKKKMNNKANTLHLGEGNPSRNINMSEVEDSLTPGAMSTSWAPVHQEAIQKLSSQPLYSPGYNLMEDILGETNTGEAEEQNSYVLCRLKEKVKNKANTLDSGEGNPSRNINMSEVEDSLTPGATSTSWAPVHQEAIQKLSSQPLYSPGYNLMEDFLGETNTGEAEEQNSYVLCRLKKKMNNKANTLHLGEGNPSRNINMSEVEDSLTPGAMSTSWAHVHQEAIQKLSSQPLYSPGYNLMGDILGETNTGEAEEQHVVLEGGRPDMFFQEPQGFIELQAAGGVSSTEMSESGRVVLEGGRPDMFFQEPQGFIELQAAGGVSSTAMSGSGRVVLEGGRPDMIFQAPQGFIELQAAGGVSSTETSESGYVMPDSGIRQMYSAERQAYNPRRHRRRGIQVRDSILSTEMSRNEVGEEAETNNSISASDFCVIAVVIISMILTAVFVLLVFGTCKLALSQLRRKRTLFVALCSVLFFWVYNYRNMPGVSGHNAMELNPTAGMLQ